MAASRALTFGKHLKELRLHLCQKSAASQGVRDFIENHYVALKQNNPRFPILVRECSGVQPMVYARYEHGREASAMLSNMKDTQVLQTIETISSASR